MSEKTKTTKAIKASTKSSKSETEQAEPKKFSGKVEVLKPYYDMEDKANRNTGEIYSTNEARASYLAQLGYAKML